MLMTKFSAFIAIASLPLASAYIQTVANFTGTYSSTTHKLFNVTFITGTTKVDE